MGGIGRMYGSIAVEHLGADALFYIMDHERYLRNRNKTYRVNGKDIPFRMEETPQPCDLIIVAVKYTGLEAALETMAPFVGEDTLILSVMNGISTEEIIGARFGKGRVIHAVAQGMDAVYLGTELTFTKSGTLCIGITEKTPEMQEKLERVAAFFAKAGIAYAIEADIIYRMWCKWMLNVGINQVTMVYNVGYGKALEEGSAEYMTMVGAMREVILLANRENIPLTEKDLKDYLAILSTLDPEAMPSMAQDRLSRRPSEVELFAGTVLRLGQKHGIPVPANGFLYRRVREIEEAY